MWLLALAGCGLLARFMGPDDVARAYLEKAQHDPLDDARAFVDPRCAGKPVWNGAPVRVLGRPMQVESLELRSVEVTDDRTAKVGYHVVGQAKVDEAKQDLKLFGKEVSIGVKDLDLGHVDLENTLALEKIDGVWKVTCAFPAAQ